MRTSTITIRRLATWCAALVAVLAVLRDSASAQQYTYDDYGRFSRARYDNGTVLDVETDQGTNVTRKRVFQGALGGGGGGGGGGCFIATAAYGSALDPHVDELRGFRERWLRPYAPGRVLIAWYEHTSPPLAAWIADHDFARAVTRALLAPIVYSIAYPAPSLVAWSLLAFAAFHLRRMRRRRVALARQDEAMTAIL